MFDLMNKLLGESFAFIASFFGITCTASGNFAGLEDVFLFLFLFPVVMIFYAPIAICIYVVFASVIIIPTYIIFYAIPLALIFKKVGIPAWHAFIPILSDMSRAKMLYNKPAYGLLLLIPIAFLYFAFKANYDTAKAFGKSTPYAIFCGLGIPFFNYGLVSAKHTFTDYRKLDKF